MRTRSHIITAALLGLLAGLPAGCGQQEAALPGAADGDPASVVEQFWLSTYGPVAETKSFAPEGSALAPFDIVPAEALQTPLRGAATSPIVQEALKAAASSNCAPVCQSKYQIELAAKAKPDECFYGLCDHANLKSFRDTYPGDLDVAQCQKQGGQPKTNQAYPWGMTITDKERIWFGTAANVLCLVAASGLFDPIMSDPLKTDAVVCEALCPNARGFTDVRPPRLFKYDAACDQLHDLTDQVLAQDKELLLRTVGIRSAGSHRGVVFFGGLTGGVIEGSMVVLFAFDANTKTYLGARELPRYSNTRQWLVAKDELYTAVGVPVPNGGGFFSAGEVLRWTGSLAKYYKSGNLDDLFAFETVGRLSGDGAYIALHEDRLFVSTWGGYPGRTFEGALLYASPRLGKDKKLTKADAGGWKVVWKLSDYEVEPTAVVVGGALASYGPHLYWGTMQIPSMGVALFCDTYGCQGTGDLLGAVLGTLRPTVLFRGQNLGTPQAKTGLLYGTSHLPRFDPASRTWQIVPNNMKQAPKYGLAGMNNLFNTYTWWMDVYKDRLFVGTFDWFYLLAGLGSNFLGVSIPHSIQQLAQNFYGADLFEFRSPLLPALPICTAGCGNYTNYGIRTMAVGKSLYLGMANPMNLLTDPGDDKPEGGWELRKLSIVELCK